MNTKGFEYRTCTRILSLSGLFPFLISCLPEAAKLNQDKWSFYSPCSLGSCYLFTRKTGDSPSPCPAHCTPQEMFHKWWLSVWTWLWLTLSEGTGRQHSWTWKSLKHSARPFHHSGIEDSCRKEQMFIIIWLQLHYHLFLFHWLFCLCPHRAPDLNLNVFPALPSHLLTPRYLCNCKKLNLHLKRAVWLQCPACQLPLPELFLVWTGKQSPVTRASNLFLPRFIEKACLCSKLASN